jgi:hypothetical protein
MKKVDFDSFGQLHPRYFSVSKHINGLGKCLIKWGHILKAKRLITMKKEDRPIRQSKFLRHADVKDARVFLIRQSQLEFFGKEIALMSKNLRPLAEIRGTKSSPIQKFNPFLDPRGVMRSRSRLTNIPGLTYEKAHPVILHRKSDYARLIVEAAHVERQHPVGIQAMNAAIRNEFAINGMGTLCRQIQSRCTEC